MKKLETLSKLNNLKKRNRYAIEDKLKQQKFYSNIQELSDPLTKSLIS